MTLYRVVWEIDIEADTPREAAEKALAIQRDPESIATVFTVAPWLLGGRIDRSRSEDIDLAPEAAS